jgi:hypothetical protein
VIKSKAPVTVAEFGDRYCLIGPLSHKTASLEVEQLSPTSANMSGAIEAMASQGVRVVYGRWLIEGYPRVLLFDLGSVYHRLNEWKADFWNVANVPSPADDVEMNDAIVFGYCVAWFLGEVKFSQTVLAFRGDVAGAGCPTASKSCKQSCGLAHSSMNLVRCNSTSTKTGPSPPSHTSTSGSPVWV